MLAYLINSKACVSSKPFLENQKATVCKAIFQCYHFTLQSSHSDLSLFTLIFLGQLYYLSLQNAQQRNKGAITYL